MMLMHSIQSDVGFSSFMSYKRFTLIFCRSDSHGASGSADIYYLNSGS